jgi:hypothetical protein
MKPRALTPRRGARSGVANERRSKRERLCAKRITSAPRFDASRTSLSGCRAAAIGDRLRTVASVMAAGDGSIA